jgi:hypothetical protein
VPNDTPTLEDLLREWEVGTAGPSYEPLPGRSRAEPAQRNAGRLQFAPPPIVRELSFNERIAPLIGPLRERVEAAELAFYERQAVLEEEHDRKMEQLEIERQSRDDIVRAKLSLQNVSTNPAPAYQLPSPAEMADMTQQQFEAVVAEYRAMQHRR